ncbi:hypothetical protein [Streptomyces sp. NPDC056723]|uniref:hypothetical protein n=1 Tax=Streptomyces sp. NPDC056723 TaxID=3345925 RepID=UPI0036764EB5
MQLTTNATVYEPGNHTAVIEIEMPADIARQLYAPDRANFLEDGESATRVFGPLSIRSDRARTHDEFAIDFALMVRPELEGRRFTVKHFSVESDRKAA